MYQRIMEILVLLMDEFGGKNWQADQMDQLSVDLIQRGYTEQEINTAFYWLYQRFSSNNSSPLYALDVNDPSDTSHRILHPQEQICFTSEAYGYVLQLKHLKLINSWDIEEIIERMHILDLQLATVEEVKLIVQSLLFEDGALVAGNLKTLGLSQKGETYH